LGGPCGSAFGVGLYCSKKSLHHSQIFPDMSSTPNGLAPRGNDPTGALSAQPSSIWRSLQAKEVFLSAKLARSPRFSKLPQGYLRPSVPLSAYSHSASVARRYFLRSRMLSHWQNFIASRLLT